MKQINLQDNLRKKFIKKGVKMMAPETVFFSKDTKIGKNVSIDPYVVIKEKVKIIKKYFMVLFLCFHRLKNYSPKYNYKDKFLYFEIKNIMRRKLTTCKIFFLNKNK